MACFQLWYNSGNLGKKVHYYKINAKPSRTTTILCVPIVPMVMEPLATMLMVNCKGYECHHHYFHQDVSAGDVPQG